MQRSNCIIVDWLSFTVLDPGIDSYSLIEFLGLPMNSFNLRSGVVRGYKQCLFFDNISINFDGRGDMGICVSMTGSGCRTFETYSTYSDFISLFYRLFDSFNRINITRFDLAYDDYENRIKLNKVKKSAVDLNGVYSPAHVKSWKVVLSDEGTSVYIGSNKSDMLVRFYDKAAERKVDFSWVRCELQMRSAVAFFAVRHFMTTDNISDLFFSLLNNYCQFVSNKDLQHAGHSKLQYWFKQWISTRDILHYTRATKEYNLEKIKDNVINLYGNSLQVFLSVFGYYDLLQELKKHRPIDNLPIKYKRLLVDYCVQKLSQFTVREFERDDYYEIIDDRPIRLLELVEELGIDIDNL